VYFGDRSESKAFEEADDSTGAVTTRWLVLALAVTLAREVFAASAAVPIYIEDSHAGSFYWLAEHLDLEEECTLIHFDAHSDASAIFDSDEVRNRLRRVASPEERRELLERWRQVGAIQCFNWIEPLMPEPITNLIWVRGEKVKKPFFRRPRPSSSMANWKRRHGRPVLWQHAAASLDWKTSARTLRTARQW
jgi:hypothetical protein